MIAWVTCQGWFLNSHRRIVCSEINKRSKGRFGVLFDWLRWMGRRVTMSGSTQESTHQVVPVPRRSNWPSRQNHSPIHHLMYVLVLLRQCLSHFPIRPADSPHTLLLIYYTVGQASWACPPLWEIKSGWMCLCPFSVRRWLLSNHRHCSTPNYSDPLQHLLLLLGSILQNHIIAPNANHFYAILLLCELVFADIL